MQSRSARPIDHGRQFFFCLAILLFGYALMGKGFAYLGIGPLYIGEMTLAYGAFALIMTPDWSRVLRTGWVWPLYAFMLWCAVRTIPFISVYGVESLRDAAIWIWGGFALTIASLMASQPSLINSIERFFRLFLKIFLIVSPLSYVLSVFAADHMPDAPWAPVPLMLVKGGDVVVHLSGILAYGVLLGGGINPWFITLLTIFDLVLTFTGRAAMVTFGLAAAIVMFLRPRSRIMHGAIATIILGVAILWVTDLRVVGRGEPAREISADQIFQNIQSIVTSSDNKNLAGSKEWRLLWWDSIIDYTVHGKYFWGGKGFGVNLADDDGFQVKEDGSLRSPHNGHLGILARAGVPGFCLWALCQIIWAGWMFARYFKAKKRGEDRWASIFIVLFVYWTAFMTNAAFDVYLESPMGGIWLWCVYGVGLGALWIHQFCPEALTDNSRPKAEKMELELLEAR